MQVWCNGQLVGEAKIAPALGQCVYEVHVMGDFDWSVAATTNPLEEIAYRKLYLPIEKRSLAVDNIEFMQGIGDVENLVLKHHNIPADAVIELDISRCRRIFSWKVFDVDLDVFEEIFDMDWFEPASYGAPNTY